jgi:hypothetical protein
MRIEIFKKGLGTFQVAEDLKNGKTHMVFVAVNGLTFFNSFAVEDPSQETVRGLSTEEASKLCKMVNEKNETGTLYPKLNISLLPLTRYEERNDWENEIAMKKNIIDVFYSNSEYIKSDQIIFAFEERGDFNNGLAVKVLESIAREFKEDGILKYVYYIHG